MTASFNSTTILANITLGQIQFTHNCEGAVKIYAALQSVPPTDPRYPYTRYYTFHYTHAAVVQDSPFPYDDFITVLRSVKPDPFRQASRGVIVDWIDNLNTSSPDFGAAVSQINATCLLEYCRHLAWQGNPDLAGVGAFASYTIGVAFATAFALAILSQRLLSFTRKRKHSTKPSTSRLPSAILTSFAVFWDSAFLFNLAVTVAAVVSLSQDTSLYNQEFTRLSASISWSIIASTWPFYAPICRHPRARWIGIWAATTAFMIVSATLTLRSLEGTEFESRCLNAYPARSGMRRTAVDMANVASMGMQALAMFFRFSYSWRGIWWVARQVLGRTRSNGGRRLGENGVARWPWVSKRDSVWRRRWRVACATVWSGSLGLGMVVCLVGFALKREMTAEVAGPSLEERKWGFGQVMALTTWLPTVVDFLLIFKGEWLGLLCGLVLEYANWCLVGNLKAVEYRLPLGVGVSIPGAEEDS